MTHHTRHQGLRYRTPGMPITKTSGGLTWRFDTAHGHAVVSLPCSLCYSDKDVLWVSRAFGPTSVLASASRLKVRNRATDVRIGSRLYKPKESGIRMRLYCQLGSKVGKYHGLEMRLKWQVKNVLNWVCGVGVAAITDTYHRSTYPHSTSNCLLEFTSYIHLRRGNRGEQM